MKKILFYLLFITSLLGCQYYPKNWTTPKQLTSTGTFDEYNAVIKIDHNNKLHVIFENDKRNIYYGSIMTEDIIDENILIARIFSGPVNEYGRTPQMAIDSAGHIHVIWREEVSLDNYKIYYVTSTDGVKWTSPVPINDINGEIDCLNLISFKDEMYICYIHRNVERPYNIYLIRRSQTNEWQKPINISNNSYEGSMFYFSSLVMLPDNKQQKIHLLWLENRVSTNSIYYSDITNNISQSPIKIMSMDDGIRGLALALNKNYQPFMFWYQQNYIFGQLIKTIGGQKPIKICSSSMIMPTNNLKVLSDKHNYFHVVWKDTKVRARHGVQGQVYYAFFIPEDKQGGRLISKVSFGEGSFPSIISDQNNVCHLIWQKNTKNGLKIHYTRYRDQKGSGLENKK